MPASYARAPASVMPAAGVPYLRLGLCPGPGASHAPAPYAWLWVCHSARQRAPALCRRLALCPGPLASHAARRGWWPLCRGPAGPGGQVAWGLPPLRAAPGTR